MTHSRTLVRISSVNTDNEKTIGLIIPGWNPEQEVIVSEQRFPELFLLPVKKGLRFFCFVNLEAESHEDLEFSSVELKQKDKIYAIAAMSLNRVIGKDNSLIWHLPNDLKFFKSMTDGHPLIMGRKTYESLPGKLPNRPHIIVTSNTSYSVDKKDVYVCHSLESAIEKAQELDTYIFISGGSQIYQEAFDKGYIDEVFLTLVLNDFEGDTYFPNIPDNFILAESIPSAKDEKNKHNFIFMHYFKS